MESENSHRYPLKWRQIYRRKYKEAFWNNEAAEEARAKIHKAGDFSSIVGKRDSTYNEIMRNNEKKERNINGKRMLKLYMVNDMIITRKLYILKQIVNGIINQRIYSRSIANRQKAIDRRVKRG